MLTLTLRPPRQPPGLRDAGPEASGVGGQPPIGGDAARLGRRAGPGIECRARPRYLPSELVVGILLLLIAATAATLLVLGILRVAVTG